MRILTNAHIHTLDHTLPLADSLAIENGRISAVGTASQITPLAKSPAEIEDLQGRCILPGLCDAHIHLLEYGNFLSKVDCETPTRAECLERVRQRAACTPSGQWILGHGWNHNNWKEGYGNAAMLDEISTQHPVYLTAKSLHTGWANSRALQMAGIDDSTADPAGGQIQRDMSGKPSGILIETAMQLVEGVIPAASLSQNITSLERAQKELLKLGITCVHDFDAWESWQALSGMDQEKILKLRVIKSIPREHLDEAIASGICTGQGNSHLQIGSLKLFSDGALGPQTAAMLEPYEGSTNNLGRLQMTVEELVEIGVKAVNNKISLSVHAIGDRANRVVLDAFEQIRAYESSRNLKSLRHRMEHVQLIQPNDQVRMAKLGVIASMQPIHAVSDREMAERYWGKRCEDAYAWNSLQKAGIPLAFGSDAPVENPNPFHGLYAAITRRRIQDPQESWYPEQCLSRAQALDAFTKGGAYVAGLENKVGTIKPKAWADLMVLEQDPLSISAEELAEIKPEAMMVNGDWI